MYATHDLGLGLSFFGSDDCDCLGVSALCAPEVSDTLLSRRVRGSREERISRFEFMPERIYSEETKRDRGTENVHILDIVT